MRARRLYTGYLTQIDHQIGRILDTLEASGQEDETFVVFSADHGEMLGDHGRYGKSCPYEAALRVPLIVAGPGVEAGTNDALIELNDVNPTLCDMAGIGPEPGIDAKSFLPLLRGEADRHRDMAFSTLRGFQLIRTAEWKYVRNDDGQHEFYNLADDPEERRNIYGQDARQVKEMKDAAAALWTEGGALF